MPLLVYSSPTAYMVCSLQVKNPSKAKTRGSKGASKNS